jgi:uncharacterized protein (TIGR03083 family)
MGAADYLSRIAIEAEVLRAAAASVAADTPVPTCPGWRVGRLVEHLGRVFDMVIRVLHAADPHSPPERVPPPTGDVFAFLDDRLATLLDVLARTDPGSPTWHFSPAAPKTAAFWSRRMAHETAVHRIDAQTAAGLTAAVDPPFAADGVDEVLTRLIQRDPAGWAAATLSGIVLYRAVDVGRVWAVRLVPGQLPRTSPQQVGEPDASVAGPADSVYRAVWGRPSTAVVSGAAALVEATRAR